MDRRLHQIEFLEDSHEYYYTDENGKHRKLLGITGAIGKLKGKSFPETDAVKLAAIYGSDVHKEIENYYNHGKPSLSSEAAKWVVSKLYEFEEGLVNDRAEKVECEVMVSDFIATASKVDVVLRTFEGKAILFDIKTTSTFDRDYCSLQLSVYKRLYEACYGEKVKGLYVLGTKFRRAFRIIEQSKERVDRILEMNRQILGL